MFSKVLVANRGEIAVSIIHELHELGIKAVAVYSTADINAQHVKIADEAVCIGKPEPNESYLNMKNIISAAILSGSDAIHPGYGFLSENPLFAKLCADSHIVFIGPKPESIELLGNKANAREEIKLNGIPIIPGYNKSVENIDVARRVAKKIGYPIMIKAVAGGGGKGIRKVYNEEDLQIAFNQAQEEAKLSFGDNRLYIEKLISPAKHIEVQIIADRFGNVVAFPERDCSMQRNHQKVVEETPCTQISEEERKKLQRLTIKAIKALKYESVGTVEYLRDTNHNFYFMEMNTRIQVEHSITEEISKFNLIKEQIKIAEGEQLCISQEKIKIQGSAIEVRINAENPSKNFQPESGLIQRIVFPAGSGIRIESGVTSGDRISPYYDSMIVKIISHAPSRNLAINKMINALKEFELSGLTTNKNFLISLLNSSKFMNATYLTTFIDLEFLPDFLKRDKKNLEIQENDHTSLKTKKNVLDNYKKNFPKNLFLNCPKCGNNFYFREAGRFKTCPKCGYGFRVSAKERLKMLTNEFVEWDENIETTDPLTFPGYKKKIKEMQSITKLKDSVLTGQAKLGDYEVALGIMDPLFIMGSLGTATGERITRLFERATTKQLPVVIFTASGGARMQEGILALMQMAKISQAINYHRKSKLLYVSVIMDPTTGGVTASFASQADIILAEPKALIGFAGRRVIEQTINEKLPQNFQSVENAYKNGFIDEIVPRNKQVEKLEQILKIFSQKRRATK